MESHPYTAMMYAQATPQLDASSMSESSWHPSTSNSSSSSSQHSQLYPYVNRSADHTDYAPSNPYLQSDHYTSAHLQPPPTVHDPSNHGVSADLTQVESSIGPERRLTRRQRALLAQGTRGVPAPSNLSRENYDARHPMYLMPSDASRPQTPNTTESNLYSQQPDRLSLNTAPSSIPLQLQSPVYPSTSGSTSSPYSPYDQYPSHSRSTSASNSIPRSTSPAGSVASELTSISSSASAPNARSLAPYSHPSTERASPIARQQKHSKKRLDNLDRKSICQFHRENPNARQEDIAVRYGVERSTISKILKHKVRWLNVSDHEEMRVAKHRPSKFPEVEEQLVKWLVETQKTSTVLSDALIRSKAKETARNMHIPDDKFKASSGWVENFKHRHGIRGGVWHGDGKNTRMARALGAGTFDDGANNMALSPLNPAFDVRIEIIGEGRFSIESERPPTSEMGLGRTSVPLQPAWQVQPGSSNPVDVSMPSRPHLPSMHRPISQQRLVQHNDESAMHLEHVSISPPQRVHEVDHSVMQHDSHHDGSATYDESVDLYQPIPTLAEAEHAVNTVITYVDSQGRGLLTDEERRHLDHIKRILFQAGSGVPFDRETR